MQHSAVARITGEPLCATLVTKRSDLFEQSVEFEQRVAIWPALVTHSAEAARRSGLTCSLFRAPGENSETSLPSRFVAAL